MNLRIMVGVVPPRKQVILRLRVLILLRQLMVAILPVKQVIFTHVCRLHHTGDFFVNDVG